MPRPHDPVRPADVFPPLPLAIRHPLKCYRFSPLFLPVEVDSNILFFLHPDASSPTSFPLFSDITMHHPVVLFLCCPKILLPSPCVSVVRVSRIKLYSFDQWEFRLSVCMSAYGVSATRRSFHFFRVSHSHSGWRPNLPCLTTVRAIPRYCALYNGPVFPLQM